MIKINDEFSFRWDVYSWELTQYMEGKDKKGNPKIQPRHTWHPDINQVCQYMLKRSLARIKSVEDIDSVVMNAKHDIRKMVENVDVLAIRSFCESREGNKKANECKG